MTVHEGRVPPASAAGRPDMVITVLMPSRPASLIVRFRSSAWVISGSGCSGLPLQFRAVSSMPYFGKIARYSSRASALSRSSSTGMWGVPMNPPALISALVRPRSRRISRASSRGLSCRQAV